jgi:ATP-dependent Clp protease ATP-binding subunit ClpA
MFDRFTEVARHTVVVAHEEARLMHHGHIGTEHLLVALADEPEVRALGLDRERARGEVVKTVGLGDVDPEAYGQIPFTAAAKQALEEGLTEAMRLGHHQIAPGHLLLAVLRQRDGVARRILVNAGAVPSDLRDAIVGRLQALPQAPPDPGDPVVVRLNGAVLGDVGNRRTDLRLLLAILERDGEIAALLRDCGLDEPALRRRLAD